MRSFIYYVCRIFRKTNISYPLIRTRTCVYQGVRNFSFSENFLCVLNPYFFINCSNNRRVTIYRAKCLDIVTLKVLPTRCFSYTVTQGKKTQNSRFREWSLTELIWLSLCELFNKMSRGFGENHKFFYFFVLFQKVYTFISVIRKVFLLSCCLMVWWWLRSKGRLVEIPSNLGYFVHIWKISNIARHKKIINSTSSEGHINKLQ